MLFFSYLRIIFVYKFYVSIIFFKTLLNYCNTIIANFRNNNSLTEAKIKLILLILKIKDSDI